MGCDDTTRVRGALVAATLAPAAFAQQPPTMRIRGPIVAVDGAMLTVTAGEAGNVKVKLTDNVTVFGVVKASLADIKPGDPSSASARCRRPTAASAPSRS